MTAPTVIVGGQVIPGPFQGDDPLHLWIEAHWDKGLPWTHRADGTDEDVPQPLDAPQVLFEDSREATGSRYNVLFRAAKGLTPHQKTAIGALPVDDPYLEPGLFGFGVAGDRDDPQKCVFKTPQAPGRGCFNLISS